MFRQRSTTRRSLHTSLEFSVLLWQQVLGYCPPDTIGYATLTEVASLFAYLRQHVNNASDIVSSAHFHHDLSMAVANSMAAIASIARRALAPNP